MNELLNGTIEFNRRLTPEERKDLLTDLPDISHEYVTLEYIDLCESYNILDEVTEWLTSHENGVKEGCFTNCYGDYDGSYRYEHGQWCWHSADSICGFGDNELIEELKYRGYDTHKVMDKHINKDALYRMVSALIRNSISDDYADQILNLATRAGVTVFDEIQEDIECASAWSELGYFNEDDVKLAIGRTLLAWLNGRAGAL